MADYTNLCNKILENIGGKENISNAVHCMTRLRLSLKDKSKANIDALKEIKGVLGAQFNGDQFHVIIGTTVGDVYKEFCKIAGLNAFQKRDHVIFSVEMLPYPRFFEITPTNIIMVMQSNAPTPRPDINSFPMDTFAIHP